MTFEIALVLGILATAVVLFVTEVVRVDLVALMVLVTLGLSGLITPEQAVSGFSNPAVITVWAVFILSGGLSRTGVAGIIGHQVLRLAGDSEVRLVMVIMVTAATLSGFMNNVGVAALLLPVVMDIARRTGRAPSKLLIPLAFSSLLGGLMTQIGTPPNILVSAALTEGGLETFALFDFTPVGAVVVAAGIAYMALIGRKLLPDRDSAQRSPSGEVDLDRVYGLREGLCVLEVPEDSPLTGKSLAESRMGSALGLNVMGIQKREGPASRGPASRGPAYRRMQLAPDPAIVFEPGDRIVVEGQKDEMGHLGEREYLTLEARDVVPEDLVSSEVDFAEVALAPRSRLAGQTLREIDFRQRFHVLVLALWRDGATHRTHLATTELQPGDTLLVHGNRTKLKQLADSPELLVSKAKDIGIYRLEKRLMAVTVPEGSPVAGKTLTDSRLGDVFSLGVMGIERGGETGSRQTGSRQTGSRQTVLIPPPDTVLEAGDTLLVKGTQEDLTTVGGLHALPVDLAEAPDLAELESEQVCLAEAVLAPRSTVAEKTLPEIHFREKYGMNVVAVMREGKAHRNLRYFPLRFGDALLLHGPRHKLKLLGSEPDFLVLTEEAQEAPRIRKAPLSALLMAGVAGSVILGLAPIFIAAVAGAVLMVLSRCLSMDEAYRAIEWRAVFLIAGMLPLGLALQETGAADLITRGVVGTVGSLGPMAVVAGLYLLTTFSAQVMPTSAVAILVAPIAIKTAADLGMSPYALMMTVSIAASGSFMSPVAHPANVLIMGPGGYRFTDYIKVGLPLTIVCLVVTLLVLPLVWPLVP